MKKIIFLLLVAGCFVTGTRAQAQISTDMYCELVVHRDLYGYSVSIDYPESKDTTMAKLLKKVVALKNVPDMLALMDQNHWKFLTVNTTKVDNYFSLLSIYYFKKE